MKYKIIFIYFLFFYFSTNTSYAQIKSSEAIYSYNLKMDSLLLKNLNNTLKEDFKRAEIVSKRLKLKLYFNDSLSVFEPEAIMDMESDKIALKIAKTFCKCNDPIYTNARAKKNYFNYKLASTGELYLVYKTIDQNWVLHNESKKINNYLCYKATQEVEVFTGNRTVKNLVTAWYCPEIPFSYGPKGYSGLPGLIFELHDKNVSFGLESLQLNIGSHSIELPSSGKLISYDNLVGTMPLTND